MSAFLLQNAQRLHQAGNLAEAARLYGEVLRINPQQFDALYALGVVFYQSSRYADAAINTTLARCCRFRNSRYPSGSVRHTRAFAGIE